MDWGCLRRRDISTGRHPDKNERTVTGDGTWCTTLARGTLEYSQNSPVCLDSPHKVILAPFLSLVRAKSRISPDLTSDIVEKHIQASDGILELVVECGALMIQGCVNLDSPSEPSTFFVRSSDSNDLRSVYFTNLAYQRAHRASGTRDYECLTSLDLCDIQQTLSCDDNGRI